MIEPAQAVEREGALIDILRAAGKGELPSGWLFLREVNGIVASTPCLLVANNDVGVVRSAAARRGFPVYGLDTSFLEIIVDGEQGNSYPNAPSDDDLVQTYAAQLKFEAIASARFYELLGDERADTRCRTPGCRRGAVALSVFCKLHHFEAIQNRPCFED